MIYLQLLLTAVVIVRDSDIFSFIFFLQVKSILVNIFGGIVDCSIVANGITSAYKRLNVKVPVVVRLEG